MELKQVEEMASILVIVATFVGSSVLELGKCFAEPIKRQFNYLCCFKKNVRTLEKESKKLETKRADLQAKVDRDEWNAQVVNSEVETWLEEVSEIQKKKNDIDTTTRNCAFGSRFSLGKKVKKMAEAMKDLRQSGNFDTVSLPPPPAARVSIQLGSTFEFESRKQMEGEIIADLKDNKANVLGICGMGGVGKTTMAKRIMNRVRNELKFEEIVMVVVSQEVDMLKIQDDIAKSLGLELEKEEILSSKVHKLHTRLTASKKKSLIILDDIWENVKLEELGIPCNGDGGCKILLTSRDRDVFKGMHVEKVHAVQVLSETEAWDLFRSNVGSCIEQENVVSVAQQVIEECKGLPIALVTVGAALRDTETKSVWEGWLQQLKSSNPIDLPVVLNDVYKPLKLSYDLLKNERAETLFLLCCLFPEDGDIPVENLVFYAMGLGMFGDMTSLGEARNRVTSTLVEMLKSRFLLLEGSRKNEVKMHDVVRDVAIYIASDEKRINCNDCTWISSNTRERIRASTSFPNLHLLLVNRESRDKDLEIDDHFFKGMVELNVFSITCWSLRQLPQTMKLLNNLRTLILDMCSSMEDISVIGKLVNLEVLIFRHCGTIESLPVEMGKLRRMRLLELSECWNLKTIAPGIISNMKELEELIVEDFGNWESEITGIKGKNASLSELQYLSSLTRLTIHINDSRLSTEQIRLPQKYDITIGCKSRDWEEYNFKRQGFEKKMRLQLAGIISLPNWIDKCVSSVEGMCVEGDRSRDLNFGVAHNMRWLTLEKCSTVKKLVNMTAIINATVFPLLETLELKEVSELEEICDIDGPYQQNPVLIFNKLSSLHISGCHKLRYVFSWSMMETSSCLAHLERLEIWHCDMMEQVLLWNEKESQTNTIHSSPLVFPKLKFLSLESLPRLRSFCEGIEVFEFHVLAEMKVEDCPMLTSFGSPDDHDEGGDDSLHLFCKPHKVKFCCLSKLRVSMERKLCPQIPIDFLAGLCELSVSRFNGKSLFTMTEIGRLVQLEKLEISDCDMMEQVILCNDEEENQMNNTNITLLAFPKLKLMALRRLPRLTSLSKGIEFLSPAEMDIENCPILESCVSTTTSSSSSTDASLHLFCRPNKAGFGSLKEIIRISGYDSVRNWCAQITIDFFSRVCVLNIERFKGMESLFPCSIARNLVNVRKLRIYVCEEMVRVIEDEEEENDHAPLPLFPNLEYLYLNQLQKLKCFCEWRRPLQLPSLRSLHIYHCDLMDKFTSGSLYTPKLDLILINGRRLRGKENVNILMQKHRSLLREAAESEAKENAAGVQGGI